MASSSSSTVPEPRVLVADRDPRTLATLVWLLREQGYRVTSVEAWKDVLPALEATPADIVLLDFQDLDHEVQDLLATLKRDLRWRDVHVIVTAAPAAGSARALLPSGADDCVSRPLRVPELLARIQAQLRAHDELKTAREALRHTAAELQRAREDIANNRQLLDILHEVTGELSATEIYRVLARRVARALGISHCSVVLASAGDTTGTVAAAYEDPTVTELPIDLTRYPEVVAALETGRPMLVQDAQTDPLFAHTRDVWHAEGREVRLRSVVTLPFALDRWRSGVLFLRTERMERSLTREDVDFADVIVKAAVAAMKRAQALELTRADNRRLEELATRDPLTRLLNRRALLERLSAEVDRCRRFEKPVSILLLDLDHFKTINDGYGHLVGDDVLRQTAALLDTAARTVDVVARYGGEEFVVILPETTPDGALIFAERLRERIGTHPFDVGGREPLHLTTSIGIASFPSPRVESTEDLFARADEALYRAKSSGRNQVRT